MHPGSEATVAMEISAGLREAPGQPASAMILGTYPSTKVNWNFPGYRHSKISYFWSEYLT